MPGLERLLYVDDSCEEKHSGTIVFGWVECHPVRWRAALRVWLEVRKDLYRTFSIPPSAELHATEFVNGRGDLVIDRTSLDQTYRGADGKVLKKDVGRAVARRCLEAIRDCDDIRVGAAFHQTNERGPGFAVEKYALYGRLLTRLDRDLADADAYAMVAMDGKDTHFRDAHRELTLDRRHVIEDPLMHDSGRSQWIQMSDLVAYTALMSLNRHRHNEFGWTWYEDFLTGSDVNGGPVSL